MDTQNTRAPLNATAGKLSAERLAKVEQLVQERLAEPIHVEDMAAVAGLSPFHFSRMFHASTGKAPHAYVTAKRMEAACELLASSDLPLAKVATRVGYRTQAHFTGVFHRHVGVTPRTYRVSRSQASVAPQRRVEAEGEEEERAHAASHGGVPAHSETATPL
jgi:AraC family transcriptional regulator